MSNFSDVWLRKGVSLGKSSKKLANAESEVQKDSLHVWEKQFRAYKSSYRLTLLQVNKLLELLNPALLLKPANPH
jgi:hypothetical protein